MSVLTQRVGDSVVLGASLLTGAALALSIALAAPASAGDEAGGEIGVLTCKTVPGSRINLLVHSTADIECAFRESDGSIEEYKGETGIGLGIDLQIAHDETLVFTVLAKHFNPGSHQLAGHYVGAKARASAGVGGGAALLVGGSDDSIGLKPAVSHSTGAGVAAGLGYLYLEAKEAAKKTATE